MSDRSKFILLDVDGVVCPLRNPQTLDKGWEKPWVYLPELPFNMYINPSMGEQIVQLASDTGATLVWCTSWLDAREGLTVIADALGVKAEMPFLTCK